MHVHADEGVDRSVVLALRESGFVVSYAAEDQGGAADDELLERAARDGAIFLTADTDFGELVWRQRRLHSGVVLMRLSGLSGVAKARIVKDFFLGHLADLRGGFAVLSPGMIRIRSGIGP